MATCLGACGGGGGGRAAPPPTPEPTVSAAVAVEASAGVTISTGMALVVVLDQSPVPGAGSGGVVQPERVSILTALRAAAMTQALATSSAADGNGGGGAVQTCVHGGTINSSCAERHAQTVLSATYTNCGLDAAGGIVVSANGKATFTVDGTGICTSGVIPFYATTTAQYTNFAATFIDSTGAPFERVTAKNFTDTVSPIGGGCAAVADGHQTADGSLIVEGLGGEAATTNLTLQARGLVVDLTSTGATCVETVMASGGLDIDDRVGMRHFSETLRDVRFTLASPSSAPAVTLDGELLNDCLGDVVVTTITPLKFGASSVCPNQGQMFVTRDDGAQGRLTFETNDIAIDVNGDLVPDRTPPDCIRAAQCTQ